VSDNEDFESRLTAVEAGVAAARSDATVARTLASAAHAEVADVKTALNAHFRVLNALRETQLDHGRRLDRLEARFDGLEARFDGLEAKVDEGFAMVDRNFSEVERKFSVVNVGIAQITAMLTNLTDPGSPAGQN
jgi:hypothetical protein